MATTDGTFSKILKWNKRTHIRSNQHRKQSTNPTELLYLEVDDRSAGQQISVFYGAWKAIFMFKGAGHWALSCLDGIQSHRHAI
jgi:hypothetical protein